jgi:hypothetical protein
MFQNTGHFDCIVMKMNREVEMRCLNLWQEVVSLKPPARWFFLTENNEILEELKGSGLCICFTLKVRLMRKYESHLQEIFVGKWISQQV